jgi:hypothetical protein
MSKSIILVTGASSGFGLMTAKALAEAGHTVYASMRETTGRNAPQVADVAAWAAENKANLRTAELDVQSDASADAGIAQMIADAGRLDVIVHNAGLCASGASATLSSSAPLLVLCAGAGRLSCRLRGEMSRRAATRRYEISESVAIKWLERVERDGSRRSVRRMRPEKPSGRVGRPRLTRLLPPGLSPRVFRRDLALDNIG